MCSSHLVACAGQINLTSETWPAGGVTIPTGRHVTVFAGMSTADIKQTWVHHHAYAECGCMTCAANETTGNAIDFGGIASAISVQTGARIEFRGLSLSHPAPQRWAVINDTYLINTAFAALPSINAAPNATVSRFAACLDLPCLYTMVARHITDELMEQGLFFMQVVYNNVSTEYYSAYSGNSPEQFTVRVSYAIQQLGSSVASNAIRQGNSTIAWKGTNYMTLSASVNTTGILLWSVFIANHSITAGTCLLACSH